MKVTTDVDIDCIRREEILAGIEHICGRIDRPNGDVDKHLTGVYFQNIPRNPLTNVSLIDHRVSGEYGYFKIDFLNVNLYDGVRDEDHLLELLDKEPPWDFFEYQEITDKLFHLKNYSHLLCKFKPQSIEDLAMILAIIRPSKAYLQKEGWDKVRKEVWIKDPESTEYQFKRGHGIAYSLAIIVNLNLMIEKMSKD